MSNNTQNEQPINPGMPEAPETQPIPVAETTGFVPSADELALLQALRSQRGQATTPSEATPEATAAPEQPRSRREMREQAGNPMADNKERKPLFTKTRVAGLIGLAAVGALVLIPRANNPTNKAIDGNYKLAKQYEDEAEKPENAKHKQSELAEAKIARDQADRDKATQASKDKLIPVTDKIAATVAGAGAVAGASVLGYRKLKPRAQKVIKVAKQAAGPPKPRRH